MCTYTKKPNTRLQQWMSDTGLSALDVAGAIERDRSYVYHLLAGRKTPGLAVASKLELLTASWNRGPIVAREWARGA